MLLMKALPFAVLSASLAMVACDSGSNSNESRNDNPVLPENPVGDGSNIAAVETAEDLMNCTESREGNMAKVLSENAIYECVDERWSKVTVIETLPRDTLSNGISSSGTSLIEISSSETSPSENSSAGETQMSSSSMNSDVSSVRSPHCFEPWHGNEMVYQILTGYDNGSETSGYWYSYADDADGGASKIIWPIPSWDDALDPVFDYCGGVCGTYYLSKGTLTYDPYAGVAFNIAGIDDNGDPTTADASAMGGVRVTYTSDITMALELGLGEKMERNIGYDVPFVTLAKASVATVKEFKWSQFKQAGWGDAKITGEEAAKILASIRFKMQGKDGTQGEFNIMSIDAYNPGDCAAFVPPVYSSSSKNMSSSSSKPSSSSSSSNGTSVVIKPAYSFETWNGAEGVEQIMTGFDTDMQDGGYWYEYDDSEDGGKSSIAWQAPLGNEYDEKSFQPVIDVCSGVCGTVQLDAGDLQYDPYVGIGFDLAGHDINRNLVLADASGMGGVCIGYSSEMSFTIEMSLGEAKDRELGYDIPIVRMPKSSSYVVKKIPWSNFKRSGWGGGENVTGEQAAKMLGSLRFKFQGKDGVSANFNIVSIGPYLNGWCEESLAPVLQ
jgi:hypothetical protein